MAVNFTEEQLAYLKDLLAIEPCHVTGTHCPDHSLNSKMICVFQKMMAWEYAMKTLGFDPKRPARRAHEDCPLCSSKAEAWRRWVSSE